MRAPTVIRWPGVIRPGTVKNDIFASLDWVPTLVEIAGGPKGDGLKKQIEAGQYPGIVKTTLDGVNQIDYLAGRSEKSARDTSSTTPARTLRGPLQELEDVLHNGVRRRRRAAQWAWFPIIGPRSVNIKRDPFETTVGSNTKYADVVWAGRLLLRPPPISTTGTCCPSASSCG